MLELFLKIALAFLIVSYALLSLSHAPSKGFKSNKGAKMRKWSTISFVATLAFIFVFAEQDYLSAIIVPIFIIGVDIFNW